MLVFLEVPYSRLSFLFIDVFLSSAFNPVHYLTDDPAFNCSLPHRAANRPNTTIDRDRCAAIGSLSFDPEHIWGTSNHIAFNASFVLSTSIF